MAIPAELAVLGPTPLRGRVRVPGDKGISHRALLFAAMATGRSRIVGLAGGDDVARTRLLLARPRRGADDRGLGRHHRGSRARRASSNPAACSTAATRARPCAPRLACSRAGRSSACCRATTVLRQRPDGARRRAAARDGRPRRRARRGLARAAHRARRRARRVARTGSTVASAQVKTALVLAGLQANGVTEITEPAPSRDHTERMLGALGAPVAVDGTTLRVTGGAPAPVRAARTRRPVVGRVLGGRVRRSPPVPTS